MECSNEACDKGVHAKGLCNTHYARLLRHGDPLHAGRVTCKTPEESFMTRAIPDPESDCILWAGAKKKEGYGMIAVNGKPYSAHRYAWERVNGPIPDGLQADHRCLNPPCVNVAHLRLVTGAQNQQNRKLESHGNTGIRGVHWNRAQQRYQATYGLNGFQIHVGYFDDLEEAAEAVSKARMAAMKYTQN